MHTKFQTISIFLADAFSDEGEEKLRLLSLYWACSEPAFRRAYYRDVENDDMAVCRPPPELLPVGAGETYSQIKCSWLSWF